MSALPIIAFISGLFTMGFLFWLLDDIVQLFATVATQGDVYNLMLFLWSASLIVYLVFGGWYTIRLYDESKYPGQYGGF